MTKLCFCQATFDQDLEDTKRCIERVSPHVDATVIAYDQSLSPSQVAELQAMHVVTVFFEWKDNMPEMRNAYLRKAKEIGADWCVVSDPDELFSEELVVNLRKFIEEADTLGYNLLPVHCLDQFENVEYIDNLDMLRWTPGGYRETDFWKPILIFKVYPDLRYEGVGEMKNVHEMLRTSVEWKSKNLPKEYPYVHHKSALRMWRNAARNMFIGGGGDNVGALNPYWTVLRETCSSLKIDSWPDFEEQVKTGFEDPRLTKWFFDALQAPPTNWGTEVRETSKWFFALHKDQVTPEILERIKNPPKLTPEMEVENFVMRAYFQVLGRHPDDVGKKQYVQAILEGRLKREELPGVMKQSLEYKQKMGAPAGPVERVKMQVPVSVDIHISEELFLEALKRSDTYWKTIKPKMDVGSFIVDGLRRRDEFLRWFYTNKEDLTIRGLVDWVENNAPEPDSVALCIMGYHKVLATISESISVMAPYVDEIHVQGDDFNEEDITYLKARGASVHIEPWIDEFSDYKNKCIAPANTEWVLILDDDEIPTRELAERLHEIVKKSNSGRNYNIVSFDVLDVETVKGEVVSERRSPGGKPFLHWNVPEPYYGNPHIWLKPNYYPWRTVHAPNVYKHTKERGTELPRSVRNVFLGGGGDNTREGNPLWVELRALTKALGIDTWKDFHTCLKKGGVDPRLLDVMKRLAEMPWKDSELQDLSRYYYLLHPGRNKSMERDKLAVGVDPPVLDYRKWKLFLVTDHRDWDEGYSLDQMWERRIKEAEDRFIQSESYEFFSSTNYPRMLIIGAGIGAEIEVANKRGYKTIGIGLLNRVQLDYALERGVDMRIMDMHDLKFPNESFDVIWSNMTFEHGISPWMMMIENWAVLREGGRYWLNLPTWQGSDKDGPGKQHLSVLPSWYMKPLLRRSGFKILKDEDNPMRHQYWLERVGLEELTNEPKNINDILKKRLEIGEDDG